MGKGSRLPLEGMLVLDCTQIMAGPFCTLLLADMGAEVIKIEKPQGGDDLRNMGSPTIGGYPAAFLAINRNKRSVALDLRRPEGTEVFKRMAARADVVVENFRPGTMERLGLGYETLREVNPAIIYCSVSGFGRTGPYSRRGGFDLVAQGMSGVMSVTGEPGRPPVKAGVPLADLNAGMYAAYGVLCAYVHRLQTGQGQMVDTSLLEGAIAYTFWESAVYFATGEVPRPLGSAHRLVAPYQALRARDGYIIVGAANQSTWEALVQVLERQDLLEDPRFATPGDRKRHEDALVPILEKVLSRQDRAYWLERLERAGVPAGPIYNLAEVYQDPHVRAREMLVEIPHPALGKVKQIGIPVKLSLTPGRMRLPPPALGEHTDEVLTRFGYTGEEVGELRKAGVIR